MDSIYEKRPWLRHYPEWAPHDLEITSDTALGDFRGLAALTPELPALFYFDHAISYKEIDRLSENLAAAFEDLDLCKGNWIVIDYRFDPGETLRLIEKWNVTVTVASITVYIALINHPDIKKRDLSSFVKAYSGGAPVSEATVSQLKDLTGLYLYNVYGMTETNSPSHIVPWGKKAPVDVESGALSVEVPVPNCVIKIMDLEEGSQELAPSEVGEIVDSGPIEIPGYWQKPEETKHAIRNGWLYTGDVGKMDKDGWFYVVDRKKDMIVASGYKVWPPRCGRCNLPALCCQRDCRRGS